ncbi:MAG TPA: hypothetical protein VFZ17_08645 [Acidimicrobiia bacterium]|nr:hypothetical protein [Acidimicrobiia bacterium]
MTRRALARVAPVLVLLLGGFGAVALTTGDASPAPLHQVAPTDRDRSPAVAAEVGANDALAVTANRISDDSGRNANRLFSIALAALVALVALLAARRTRPVAAFAAHRDSPLASRRRGPPLLRCA